MNTRKSLIRILFLALLTFSLAASLTSAQEMEPLEELGTESALGTAITYQGSLTDGGSPADGIYDFEFTLYDEASIGSTVGIPNVVQDHPVSEGLFTVILDFGDVFDGSALWLEVAVRPGNSSGAYTRLTPRQPLTAAPFAHSLRPGASVAGNVASKGVLNAENSSPDGRALYGAGTNGGYGVYGETFDTVSNTTPGVFGLSSSPGGRGVYGYATSGTGRTFGVYGRTVSPEGIGVRGYAATTSGLNFGVYGKNDSTEGTGVYGITTATSGMTYGVYGKSESTQGTGVYGEGSIAGVEGKSSGTYGIGVKGHATAASDLSYGLHGQSESTNGYGVYGVAAATSGMTYGVYGRTDSINGRGVSGFASSTSGEAIGVRGKTESIDGVGVVGLQTGYNTSDMGDSWKPGGFFAGRNGVIGVTKESGGAGVMGIGTTGGYAGYFVGDVYVFGDLDASSKSFKIDHPLDPSNKYLYHYSTESAERLNQYSGNISLDDNGEAWVELAVWFEALNTDFRYQLTCLGGYAPVYIAREIENNRFLIAGGEPGMKVSWMVTALRDDEYARQNPAIVEQDKPESERGSTLYVTLDRSP